MSITIQSTNRQSPLATRYRARKRFSGGGERALFSGRFHPPTQRCTKVSFPEFGITDEELEHAN